MEKKEIMMVILIAVLVITTGIQTIQLTGLTKAEVVVPTTSAPASSSGSSSAAAVPTNLQNLPSMVGGC